VFTSSSFNNRFEHESSLFEPISSKLTSSSARLHPYLFPWFSSFPSSHMLVQHITLVFAAQEPFSALRSDQKQAILAIHLCIKGEVHFSFLHTYPSSFFLKFLQHLSLLLVLQQQEALEL